MTHDFRIGRQPQRAHSTVTNGSGPVSATTLAAQSNFNTVNTAFAQAAIPGGGFVPPNRNNTNSGPQATSPGANQPPQAAAVPRTANAPQNLNNFYPRD